LRKRLDVEIVGQGRRLRRVRAPRRRPQDAGASKALNSVRAGPMLRVENFFNRARDVASTRAMAASSAASSALMLSSETGGSIARMRVVTALRARS
jgi:hypothetical protein